MGETKRVGVRQAGKDTNSSYSIQSETYVLLQLIAQTSMNVDDELGPTAGRQDLCQPKRKVIDLHTTNKYDFLRRDRVSILYIHIDSSVRKLAPEFDDYVSMSNMALISISVLSSSGGNLQKYGRNTRFRNWLLSFLVLRDWRFFSPLHFSGRNWIQMPAFTAI